MTQFGQAGHAGDYKPVAITEIAKGYASGALDTRPSVVSK
jgi:fructose-bisphosphate aldolase, class II